MIKLRVFDLFEKFSFNVIGPFYRNFGIRLAAAGLRLQGDRTSDDRRKMIKNNLEKLTHYNPC